MRALTERIDREAAKREEHFEREAAKREEQFEKEVAKREEAIRTLMDRSDSKFESLLRRSDELYRQSAGVNARVAHNEGILATMQPDSPGVASELAPESGQSEAVAAQDVPGDRPLE